MAATLPGQRSAGLVDTLRRIRAAKIRAAFRRSAAPEWVQRVERVRVSETSALEMAIQAAELAAWIHYNEHLGDPAEWCEYCDLAAAGGE